jgi:hypothetical protein
VKFWCKPNGHKYAFGAALHTRPFDRVNGDKRADVFDFFRLYVHRHAKAQFRTRRVVSSMELGPRSPRNTFGAARHTTPFDRVNGDI